MICDSGNRVFGGSRSSRIAFPECEAMRRNARENTWLRQPEPVHFTCSRVYSRVLHTGSQLAYPGILANFQTNESSNQASIRSTVFTLFELSSASF